MITNNTPWFGQDMQEQTELKTLANRFYRGEAGRPDNPAETPYYFMRSHMAAPEASPNASSHTALFVRDDFPILKSKVNGKPLVWLDNAATTQKPQSVIDAVSRYYSACNSNVHRGAHTLAQQATQCYEEARSKVRGFIGASSNEEIVFVRGATEGINLVAASWGMANLMPGDEILLTEMEHHSNIVPWQRVAEKTGAVIKAAPMDSRGDLKSFTFEQLFTPRTKLVAVAHVSNVLGTVNPVRQLADMAHRHGALILVDGAQSAPHMPINVQEMDADFFVFSGHKVYAPTGIGVLYGKKALLETMPPYQSGGGMIQNVSFEQTQYQPLPAKFEAGTGNIADAVGLGAAIDYLSEVGMERIEAFERTLTQYMMEGLGRVPGLTLIGTSMSKTSVASFVMNTAEPMTIAQQLNNRGIAIRAGHHCAQPALAHYGLNSAARASLGLYNTYEDIDALVRAVRELAAR